MLGGLYAQEAPKQYTLQECVDIALEKNLRVKRSLYSIENSKINLLQSKMAFLPTVNGSGGYGQNYGRALNPVTNLYTNRNSNTINVQALCLCSRLLVEGFLDGAVCCGISTGAQS